MKTRGNKNYSRKEKEGDESPVNQNTSIKLDLIRINDLWLIQYKNMIPVAQISFLCDLNEIDKNQYIDKWNCGQYKTYQLDSNYIQQFYSSQNEITEAQTIFEELQSQDSELARIILALINSSKQRQIDPFPITETSNDIISSFLRNLNTIISGNVVDAFYKSVQNLMSFGFYYPTQLPPMLPKLTGLQLLLALIDCFGSSQGELLYQLVRKELFFGGDNLLALIEHYQQDPIRQTKKDIMSVVLNFINRLNKMKQNGIRNSLFIASEFERFYSILSNSLFDDSFVYYTPKESSLVEKDKLKDSIPAQIQFNNEWEVVKAKIIRNETISNNQRQIWKKAAYQELYYDALLMFGEVAIIQEQNAENALDCYKLLRILGENKSLTIHCSLLCYLQRYEETLELVSQTSEESMSSNSRNYFTHLSQIHLNQIKQSIESLKLYSKQNSLNASDLYLFRKTVSTDEERNFVSLLCVFKVVVQSETSKQAFHHNYLLAKLICRGQLPLTKSHLEGFILLKTILRLGQFEMISDFISKLFIKRFLSNMKKGFSKEEEKLVKQALQKLGFFPKVLQKSSKSSKEKKVPFKQNEKPTKLPKLFSEEFYHQILSLNRNELKTQIVNFIQIFKTKQQLQYISSGQKQHYQDLIKIANDVIYPSDSEYSLENLEINLTYLQNDNTSSLRVFAESMSPSDLSSLKYLVLRSSYQFTSTKIFAYESINYNILKFLYAKKTKELKKYIEQNSQKSIVIQGEKYEGGKIEEKEQEDVQSSYFISMQKQLETNKEYKDNSNFKEEVSQLRASMANISQSQLHSNHALPNQVNSISQLDKDENQQNENNPQNTSFKVIIENNTINEPDKKANEQLKDSHSKLFSIQLTKEYTLDISGRFMQDHVLIFIEEDLILSTEKSQEGSFGGVFAFNKNQKFEAHLIRNPQGIFSEKGQKLLTKNGSYCLTYFGFYVRGEQWYVLSDAADERLNEESELTFSEIYQIFQLAQALSINDIQGVISQFGISLFLRKDGKLFLPNIITLVEQISDSGRRENNLELAPELFLENPTGKIRSKIDIWSLGAIIFRSVFKISLIENSNDKLIQNLLEFKNSDHLKILIEREKEKYQEREKEATSQTNLLIPIDILEIYCGILKLALEFDPELRKSALEISNFILGELQKSEQCIDKDSVDQFLSHLDSQTIIPSSEQEDDESEQILFLTGSSGFVWVNYLDKIVFYRNSIGTMFILSNPDIQKQPTKVDQILQGEGLMINKHNEIFIGWFYPKCIPKKITLLGEQKQGKNMVCLDFDVRGLPSPTSVATIIEDAGLAQLKNIDEKFTSNFPKELIDSEGMKGKSEEIMKQLEWFFTAWNQSSQKLPDIFGNKVSGMDQSNKGDQPIIFENLQEKTICVFGNNSSVSFDHTDMAIQFFGKPEIQQENSHHRFVERLENIYCKRQEMSTTFMLQTLFYFGGYQEGQYQKGLLLFGHGNSLKLDEIPNIKQPYETLISYKNNHSYSGWIENGMYQGQGTYSNKNQVLYEGIFQSNLLKFGTIYFEQNQNIIKYEGEVIFDLKTQTYLMHGEGKCYMKNKSIFEGQFERNTFNGKGKITFKNKKAVYEGNFKDGMREGHGVFSSKKNKFEGNYSNDRKVDFGKQVKQKGKEIYQGMFFNGKRHGKGILFIQQPIISVQYEGEFFEDKRHGEGIEITSEMRKYLVKYYKDLCIRRNPVNLSTSEKQQYFSPSGALLSGQVEKKELENILFEEIKEIHHPNQQEQSRTMNLKEIKKNQINQGEFQNQELQFYKIY